MAIDRTSRPWARTLGAALLAGLTAACAAVPKTVPPVLVVVPPPPPPPASKEPPAKIDWRDEPQTPGDWRWSMQEGRSTAQFVDLSGIPLAKLQCNRSSGTILLERKRLGSPLKYLSVRTTVLPPRLLVASEGTASDWIGVQLPVRDPLLDAIAFSRGRFTLELVGRPELYLPSWPEISRVIEDCR